MPIQEIRNYRLISKTVGTGGQPEKDQFRDVRDAGYEIVINLLPSDSPKAVAGESSLVQAWGMQYVHIPVSFDAPKSQDALAFFAVMDKNKEKRIFIHCAANYRVASFVYMYRTLFGNVSAHAAEPDLLAVWTPNDTWRDLMALFKALPPSLVS